MRISDWSSDVCSSDLLRRATASPADDRTHQAQGHRGRDENRNRQCRCINNIAALVDQRQLQFVRECSRLQSPFGRDSDLKRDIPSLRTRSRVGDDNVAVAAYIGRASCRERVCHYVSTSAIPVPLTNKTPTLPPPTPPPTI